MRLPQTQEEARGVGVLDLDEAERSELVATLRHHANYREEYIRSDLVGDPEDDPVERQNWWAASRWQIAATGAPFHELADVVERTGRLDLTDASVRHSVKEIVEFAEWRLDGDLQDAPPAPMVRVVEALRAAELDVRAERVESAPSSTTRSPWPDASARVRAALGEMLPPRPADAPGPVEAGHPDVAGAGPLSRLLADPRLAQAQREVRGESWAVVERDYYEVDPDDLGPGDDGDDVLKETQESRRARGVRRLEHVSVAERYEVLAAYLAFEGRAQLMEEGSGFALDGERAPWRTVAPPSVPPVRDVEVDWVLADDPRLVPLVMERAMDDDYVCRGLTRELQASWPSSSLLAAAALGAVWARGHDGAGPIPAGAMKTWGQEVEWAHAEAGVQGSLLRSVCQDVAEGLPPEQMGAAIREGAVLARDVGLPVGRMALGPERVALEPAAEQMQWDDPADAGPTV